MCIRDSRTHLQAFLVDPAHYAMMGVCGRRLLETDHTLELYAQAIATLASEGASWRPYTALREMHKRVSTELGMWMTSSESQGAVGPFGQNIWGSYPELAAPRRHRRLDRQHMSTFHAIEEATVRQVNRMRGERDAAVRAIRQVVAEEIDRWDRWSMESTGDL